jgi:hypothetical protein
MPGSKKSIQILLGLLSLVTAFHLCILVKLVPYSIAWGGGLKSDQEMYVFEIVSIVINLFLMAVLLMKGGYLKVGWKEKIINIILWIFLFIFLLNTVGNALANTNFEKMFSLLTLILAILLWNILKRKPTTEN